MGSRCTTTPCSRACSRSFADRSQATGAIRSVCSSPRSSASSHAWGPRKRMSEGPLVAERQQVARSLAPDRVAGGPVPTPIPDAVQTRRFLGNALPELVAEAEFTAEGLAARAGGKAGGLGAPEDGAGRRAL